LRAVRSVLIGDKKLFIAALSQTLPERPIEQMDEPFAVDPQLAFRG
jgi:hypothetical protein